MSERPARTRVSLIVAAADNGVIGREGQLPWRLSADLRRFKQLTLGHHIIMGRKTFESIGRLLPGRTSVVVTRQTQYAGGGAKVAGDLEHALDLAAGDDEVFIVGGGDIYQLALPLADRVYLTRVDAAMDGDAHFPPLAENHWRLTSEESHPASENNDFPFTFQIFDRITDVRNDQA